MHEQQVSQLNLKLQFLRISVFNIADFDHAVIIVRHSLLELSVDAF